MLKRELIRETKSPAGPTLFIIEIEGKIRLVVDYGALNQVTIRDQGPTPLTTRTPDRLHKAKTFTKIDLQMPSTRSVCVKETSERPPSRHAIDTTNTS